MKSGLIVLVASLAVVVAGIGLYSYGGSQSSVVPSSTGAQQEQQRAAAQLSAEDAASTRKAQGAANAPGVAKAQSVAGTEQPDLAAKKAPTPPADDDAGASVDSSDPNARQGSKATTPAVPAFDTKYANMTVDELRLAYTNLLGIIQAQQEEPVAGKDQPAPKRLTGEQVDALVREAAWVKEHAYP